MSDCSIASFAPAGTWLLVIIGWLIVNYQHNQRETRKETRARLDTLLKRLCELEQAAVKYHTEERNEAAEWQIKNHIDWIGATANRLHLTDTDELGTAQYGLRRAITLRNFESPTHQKLAMASAQIMDIGAAVQELTNLLESAYAEKYLR